MSSSTAIYDESLGPSGIGRPRRLGSLMSLPRLLYLLYLPLLMLTAGLACWVVETDFMLMVGAVTLGSVAAYLFFGLTIRLEPLRVSNLLVATLGLGYGLGAAIPWFTLDRSGVGLGEFLHKDPVALTHTMGSVLVSMAVLLAVGEYAEKPLFGDEFELRFPPQAVFFITFGVAIIGVAYLRGSLNFQGVSVGEGGHLSIFASFASWLVSALFGITFWAVLNVKGKALQRYLILLLLVQFVLVIPLGRRVMIYTVLVSILAMRLGRYRLNWSWPKRIIVGLVLAGLLYVTSIAFFYMRIAGYSAGKVHLSLPARISLAITYFESKDFSTVQESFSKNVKGRSFILGYLAELEDYSLHFTPGYGRDMQGQVLMAVPSAIYPSKDLTFGEEALDNELFGSTYFDEANSIFTAGATDFGLLGIIAYPLLLCWVFRSFFEVIGQSLPTFVATFIILAGINGLLQPETGITSYIIDMRNSLLFGAVVWFFIALPAFRLRKES
jgi:hypothetical protein